MTERRVVTFPAEKQSLSTICLPLKHPSLPRGTSIVTVAWFVVEPCSNLACPPRYARQEEKLFQVASRTWVTPNPHKRQYELLIWDFQYDSYISFSCRFGLLACYWVPSSTWLALLMVDWCALSLGSSLFSEVLRTSSLLGGLTHEVCARLASTLWLEDVIQ